MKKANGLLATLLILTILVVNVGTVLGNYINNEVNNTKVEYTTLDDPKPIKD